MYRGCHLAALIIGSLLLLFGYRRDAAAGPAEPAVTASATATTPSACRLVQTLTKLDDSTRKQLFAACESRSVDPELPVDPELHHSLSWLAAVDLQQAASLSSLFPRSANGVHLVSKAQYDAALRATDSKGRRSCRNLESRLAQLASSYDDPSGGDPPFDHAWLQQNPTCRHALGIPAEHVPLFIRTDHARSIEITIIEPSHDDLLFVEDNHRLATGVHELAILSVPRGATVIAKVMLSDVQVPWIHHAFAVGARTLLDERPALSCLFLARDEFSLENEVIIAGEPIAKAEARLLVPTDTEPTPIVAMRSLEAHVLSLDPKANELRLSQSFEIEAKSLLHNTTACTMVPIRAIGNNTIALVDAAESESCRGRPVATRQAADRAKEFFKRHADTLGMKRLRPFREIDRNADAVFRQMGDARIGPADGEDPSAQRIELLERFRARLWSTQVDQILVAEVECLPTSSDQGNFLVRYTLLSLSQVAKADLDIGDSGIEIVQEEPELFDRPGELAMAAEKALGRLFKQDYLFMPRASESTKAGTPVVVPYATSRHEDDLEVTIRRFDDYGDDQKQLCNRRAASPLQVSKQDRALIEAAVKQQPSDAKAPEHAREDPSAPMRGVIDGKITVDGRWGVYLVALTEKPAENVKLEEGHDVGKLDAICVQLRPPNDYWVGASVFVGAVGRSATRPIQVGIEARVGYANFRRTKRPNSRALIGYGGTFGYRHVAMVHRVAPTLDDTSPSADAPFIARRDAWVLTPAVFFRSSGVGHPIVFHAGPTFDIGRVNVRRVPAELTSFRDVGRTRGAFDGDIGMVAGLDIRIWHNQWIWVALGLEVGSRQLISRGREAGTSKVLDLWLDDTPHTAFDDRGFFTGFDLRMGGWR